MTQKFKVFSTSYIPLHKTKSISVSEILDSFIEKKEVKIENPSCALVSVRDQKKYRITATGESEWKKKWRNRQKKIEKKKRKLRKRLAPSKHYKVYIVSPFWETRKNQWFQKFPRRCQVCGSSEFPNLHHAFYGSYGSEKDEDLICLCQTHHEQFHKLYGVKKNLRKETKEFISAIKGQIELNGNVQLVPERN